MPRAYHWDFTGIFVELKGFFYVSIEKGCDQRSSEREPCNPQLKAPFVKPEDCIKRGCCYDDMFMSEPSVWYYNPTGRVWCFTKKGGGTDTGYATQLMFISRVISLFSFYSHDLLACQATIIGSFYATDVNKGS